METGIAHIQLNSYRLTRTLRQLVSVSLINCFALLILAMPGFTEKRAKAAGRERRGGRSGGEETIGGESQ